MPLPPYFDPRGETENCNTLYTLTVYVPPRPPPRWLPSLFTRTPVTHPNTGPTYMLPPSGDPNKPSYDCCELKDLDSLPSKSIKITSSWFPADMRCHHLDEEPEKRGCDQGCYVLEKGGNKQVLGRQARLRNATLEDADDISTVIINAFSSLPDWQYLYQFRQDFPEEHRRCGRGGVTQLLSKASTHAEVIEAPANSDIALVAVAIWTKHESHDQAVSHLMSGKCMHKDLNITRAIDYERKFTAAKRKYIDEGFGTNQLYLGSLGTHPDYQLRGAGTQLVNAGIEAGRKEHVNITLIAQPTAETFYLHLGFTSVANISITSVDNDQVFRYNVMAYHFNGNSSR